MPHKNRDLHGRAPGKSPTVVLLIDVINSFEFPGWNALLSAAKAAEPALIGLLKKARRSRIPVVHLNDNFGRWQTDFHACVRFCVTMT